jgi:predicted RNase H-like nuclease
VGADDLLDACACAWSARRIAEGRAVRFPADPPQDARGLRMAIHA